MGQAYTDEDLPGILNDIKIIYGKIEDAKLPKDQADAVVAKIASDMNRTSVSEVMKKLDQYVPKAGTGQTPGGTASTRNSQNLLNPVLILAYVRLLLNR
jgi:hypothetical protein